MGRKYKWVCDQCGSDAVMAEGNAWWNTIDQRWEWGWDQTYCDACGDVVLARKEFLPPEIPENVKVI